MRGSKMRFFLSLLLLSAFVGNAISGEPGPVAFDSVSYGLTLSKPYGASTLVVECTKSPSGDFRIVKSVKLITQNGTIVAPSKFTEKVKDPYRVEITSLETNDGMGEFSVKIIYDLSKENAKKKPSVTFEFNVGKFVQY
jgi:hypothetical protein